MATVGAGGEGGHLAEGSLLPPKQISFMAELHTRQEGLLGTGISHACSSISEDEGLQIKSQCRELLHLSRPKRLLFPFLTLTVVFVSA